MKEKVLYINLPDGADYRRVQVTEDGRIVIIYTEKEVSKEKSIKVPLSSKPMPKPIPLIGGTEVYQKDNDTPYWYCKIKEERDEFMHLYFEDLTERDLLYYANGKKRKFVTNEQKRFKNDALQAIRSKPAEGYRWIPVFEPSKDLKGNLQYVAGEKVLTGLNSYDWENLFNEYSPDNGSKQASITTYFLLLLRWLKDGIATIEEMTNNSTEIGHYWDSEDAKKNFEKTGEREFGGLYGFVGNTQKIVQDPCSKFSIVGGSYCDNGKKCQLAAILYDHYPNNAKYHGIGLLELTK